MMWIRENIEKIPSIAPFLENVDIIEQNIYSNPTLCVESCKSLIEGICKTILTNKNIEFSKSCSFSALVQQTITSILNTDEEYREDIIDLTRRISGVADRLGLIRNNVGFISHGMDVLNPRLTSNLSVLAYRITDTIGGFILSCYNSDRLVRADHRLHYEDCQPFNIYFDEQYPMQFGLSASHALFDQDYEAYKASYFDYLSDLVAESDSVS